MMQMFKFSELGRLCPPELCEGGPHRLTVRTAPFHGVNRGSIPREVMITKRRLLTRQSLFVHDLKKRACARFGRESKTFAL